MLLSNLKKWSRTISTISTFLTQNPLTKASQPLVSLAPEVNTFSFQTNSLWFVRNQSFGSIRFKPSLPHRTRSKFNSPKRRVKRKLINYRLRNHNGFLRRIKIVGPRHNRRFKFSSAFKRHGNRRKSTSNLRRKRKTRYISLADVKRAKRLIPLFKRQKFKNAH